MNTETEALAARREAERAAAVAAGVRPNYVERAVGMIEVDRLSIVRIREEIQTGTNTPARVAELRACIARLEEHAEKTAAGLRSLGVGVQLPPSGAAQTVRSGDLAAYGH